ncbi:hypothetical protein [Cronobacter sakazakii]|uniref:hypothetical protein n=1 Tax=Cronobacter sakazakii TaxID=28141 RepID=UPI000DA20563|nr:hypothetical protein [Cronobacter sakazakii]ELY2556063.1 hypothetical protein [Cronobacter sakazakii]ELY2692837.1 hypothetical protein [Cronobacter sakazakii]EME1809095.1 hypothetical protein [Cronobacter sakazakii]HDK7229052.1 hypothetical protein [Cronobacter sakazakii]HDK7317292.1 hypothetical protein [Cronobacter sakazakii]
MTFTKEQLIAAAHGRIDFANMMLSDNPEPLKERTWSIELELARIALSALRERAEPVAYADPQAFRNFQAGAANKEWMWAHPDAGLVPVFAEAPPAPVVDEWTNEQCLEFLAVAFRHAEIKGDFELDDLRLGVKMANAMTPVKEVN